MSKIPVTVFVCAGKDCARAWRKVSERSPKKWIKERLRESGMPIKLKVVETSCMDACKHAANVCFVHGHCAEVVDEVRSHHDADRIMIHLHSCIDGVNGLP